MHSWPLCGRWFRQQIRRSTGLRSYSCCDGVRWIVEFLTSHFQFNWDAKICQPNTQTHYTAGANKLISIVAVCIFFLLYSLYARENGGAGLVMSCCWAMHIFYFVCDVVALSHTLVINIWVHQSEFSSIVVHNAHRMSTYDSVVNPPLYKPIEWCSICVPIQYKYPINYLAVIKSLKLLNRWLTMKKKRPFFYFIKHLKFELDWNFTFYLIYNTDNISQKRFILLFFISKRVWLW